jgi:hypothetical protein
MQINIIILGMGKTKKDLLNHHRLNEERDCLCRKLMRRVANLSRELLTLEKYKQAL